MRPFGSSKERCGEHCFEMVTSGYLAGDHGFRERLVRFLLHRFLLRRLLVRAKRTLQGELAIGIIRAP